MIVTDCINDIHKVQRTVNNLSLDEIWELWKQNICYKGVYLDSVLKMKIEEVGSETEFQNFLFAGDPPYFDTYTVYNGKDKYHHVSYLWVNPREYTKVSGRLHQKISMLNGKFAFSQSRYVKFTGIFKKEFDEEGQCSYYIEILSSTNETKNPRDNDLQSFSFGKIDEDELDWGNKVKNLNIEIPEKTLEENSFIDIPIRCFSCSFLLRILLNPYSFSYDILPDGSICLNKCLTKRKTTVSIPAMIDGKIVSRIGKRCFFNCKDVLAVSIPEGITSIGSYAFDGCENMERIEIPKTVTDIGRYAFNRCKRMNSIHLPNSVTEIRSYTFAGCWSLSDFIIPEGCEKIGYRAFWRSGLRRVAIPKSVKYLAKDSFRCRNLKVLIPLELEYLLVEKARRHWFGFGNNGPTERIEEMDFSVACDIFERKTQFYGGTILCFYDGQCKVVKKAEVR